MRSPRSTSALVDSLLLPSRRGEPGKSYTWSAGLIADIDLFEPAFFGISPREAAQMDPQQRLLLELVWHALEDAGIPPSKLAGSATGVYIGGSSTDYRDLRLGDPASGDSYFMTGGTLSILANRISYVFDLHGPSLTVDTACSSSLVALHHACEAIRDGRIASAIVGGINLLLAPYPFLGFSRASMLSRRGRCFAFDERADGYVRGEGGGVVILKPLEDALADGDPIRAVILGSGVNSDGRTIGLSLPSEAAQASLIRSVHRARRRRSRRLAFFEMHGTGTPAGDPIEAAAVGRALGQGRSRSAADRLGKDQYRPPGTGFRHGRAAQGGAGARPGHRAADPALRGAEPEHPVRRAQSAPGTRRRGGRGGEQPTPGSTPLVLAAPTAMSYSPAPPRPETVATDDHDRIAATDQSRRAPKHRCDPSFRAGAPCSPRFPAGARTRC